MAADLQRVTRVVEWLVYKQIVENRRDLAEKMGYTESSLSQILNGKVSLSEKFIKKLANMSDEIDLDWLLTGNSKGQTIGNIGHMSGGAIVSGSHNRNIGNIRNNDRYDIVERERIGRLTKGIPYYDVDFIGGFDDVENDQTITPAHYIDFPQYNKAESWVNVTGHSMEPLINHGDIIAIKKLEDWNTYLLYGEVYAIVTVEYRTIKYVRKSPRGDDYLRLVPANNQFDEQDIPKSVIRSVFQILGCAKRL